MNIRGLKRGFTLVELLIVVAILAILSGAAYIGIQRSQARVMNEKVMDDLLAISNALEQYKQDNGNYPTINKPLMLGKDGGNMNVNCFNADTTYAHDCVGAAFLQAQIDNNLLTKRYLQEVPLDPRTHSRYVYGVTVDGQYFQVAGNYLDAEDKWIAKVRGNVKKGYQLSSLIRAFDGDNFVKDGEGYLPYSPDHLSLTATLDDINGTVKVDGLSVGDGTIVKPGSTIEADPGATVIIYFSDGSVTHLNGVPNGAELRVLPNTEVQQNDEDGIITKIRLKLFSGKIWSKVARLASESEFNVETTTAIAGVRGTEFGMEAESLEIIVRTGEVLVRAITTEEIAELEAADREYIEFEASAESFDIVREKVESDGTLQKFSIPAHGAPVLKTITPEETTKIEADYYGGAFNNNYTPRILEIDTMTGAAPPADPRIVFEYVEGVNKIVAISPDTTYADVIWEGASAIQADTANNTLTVIPDLTAEFAVGKMVQFYFESANGDQTGLSQPAVFIGPDVQLAGEEIYTMTTGDVATGAAAGGAAAPQNTVTASNDRSNLGGEITFTSVTPCIWSITSGGGALSDTTATIDNVIYHTIDPNKPPADVIVDIGDRFRGTAQEPVTIACTVGGESVSTTINVIYAPKSVAPASPDGSGYQYSWFAAGGKSWYEAKVACGGWNSLTPTEKDELQSVNPALYDQLSNANSPGLMEGTDQPGMWHLPSYDVYDGLSVTAGETSPTEGALWCGTWTGNDCSDMPDGVASIWLEEEQNVNYAWKILGSNLSSITGSPKITNDSWQGVRCVR